HRRTRHDRELLAREELQRRSDRRVALASRGEHRPERQQHGAAEAGPQQLPAAEIDLERAERRRAVSDQRSSPMRARMLRTAARRLQVAVERVPGYRNGMPLYEYRCTACGKRVTVLTLRVGEDVQPKCDRCGATKLERLMSRFAMVRSEDA